MGKQGCLLCYYKLYMSDSRHFNTSLKMCPIVIVAVDLILDLYFK